MKLCRYIFIICFCCLYSFVCVLAEMEQEPPFTKLTITGPWTVHVDAQIKCEGKIRNISSNVSITPPDRVEVVDEPYEKLPPYNPKGGGWSNGVALHGVEAYGCSHYDGLCSETVRVKTQPGDNGILLKKGIDYDIETRWGVVGTLPGGRLTDKDKAYISYAYTPQRIDSIILAADEKVIVRKGEAASTLPKIPELQKDEILLANIYFDHREKKLTEENLFPLMGKVVSKKNAPTAAKYLPKTLEKLRTGKKLKVLAWGDSVTVGAYLLEERRWPQQFVEQLKTRFPEAEIELFVEAWGGYSTQMYMLEPPDSHLNYQKKVVAVKPDLIVMEFVNDAAMTEKSLQETYTRIVNDMRGMGTEMLILSPHYVRPDWMGLKSQKNIDNDPRPYIKFLRKFTRQNKIALADGSAAFGKLWRQGIPYNIMMTNCINHPDERGMKIFVDALMAVFPESKEKAADFSLKIPSVSQLNSQNCSCLLSGSCEVVADKGGTRDIRLGGEGFKPLKLSSGEHFNPGEGVIEFDYIPRALPRDSEQMIITRMFNSQNSGGSVSIGVNRSKGINVFWFYLDNKSASQKNYGVDARYNLEIGKTYKIAAAWDKFNLYLYIDGKLLKTVQKKFSLSFGKTYTLGQGRDDYCDVSDFKVYNRCCPVKSGYQLFIPVGCSAKEMMHPVGEEVEFPIVAWKDGHAISKGIIEAVLSNDGKTELKRQRIDLSKGKASIKRTLTQPGFLQCHATLLIDGKPVATTVTSAGFDPEKIAVGTQAPSDFTAFWENGKKSFAAIPLDVRLDAAPEFSNNVQACYRISFAAGNKTRIYGFLSVPKAEGKFPAVVVVPGAGPSINDPRDFLVDGAIVLFMNVHAYEPVSDHKKLLEMHNKTYANVPNGEYAGLGIHDPEAYFFRRVYLGMSRAVDYLATHPKFDGRHLGVTGSSQGGGSALILAGLNPQINYVVANIPGLCDHGGYLKGRPTGWPHFDVMFPNDAAAQKTAGYFDVAYFAKNIHCPVIVIVGLVDPVCPPSSVYAAYNEIASSEKTIVPEVDMAHSWPPSYGQGILKMMKDFMNK